MPGSLYSGENDVEDVVQDGASVPTHADILEQLDRIRSSSEFDAPERARQFFTYVSAKPLRVAQTG